MVVRVAPRAPSGAPSNAPEFDREQRRARPDARPGERPPGERRSSIDSLAIGAPLTAAFVGALLVESGAAPGGSATPGGAADGAAAHTGGPGAGGHDGARESGQAGWSQLASLDGARSGDAETGGATDLSAEAGVRQFDGGTSGGGGDVSGTAPSSAALSAGAGAKAAITAGPQVNLTLLSASEGLPGADDGTGGAAPGNGGQIGKHIEGGAAGDVLHGTEFDDHIKGGAGDDVIYGHAGDDVLDGGLGNDRLYGGAGNDRLLGGEGHDQLYGGAGDDVLLGEAGNDLLFGGTGRDRLEGGAGEDLLDGGAGADRMSGGTGDDVLLVDNIHDLALETARGPDGGGTDILQVEAGFAQHLATEFGADAATFVLSGSLGVASPEGTAAHRQQVGTEIEHVTLTGSADHDIIGDAKSNILIGNDGDNALFGRGGDDVLRGGAGDDLLDGGAGKDQLYGGPGDDILRGGSGKDELYGGAGNDILDGGPGADRLYGGAGNDTYLLGLNDSAVDTIFDHEGVNKIALQDGSGRLIETAVAGNDLYIVVDKNTVAVIDGFRGSEGVWEGIDSGAGVVPISELMANNASTGPALATPAAVAVAAPSTDLLADYLARPSLVGSERADVLTGTNGADWLVGNAGDDHLIGGAGHDILQGGAGHNLLEGGAGDDLYLFKTGDAGLSTIRDIEGANSVRLEGFDGAKLQAVVVGRDLMVVANHAPLFKVENYVGNEDAFAGIERGESFIPTQDLFA